MVNRFARLYPIILAVVAVLLLAGCTGRGIATAGLDVGFNETASIDDAVVARPIRYVDGLNAGPIYNVSLEVPDEWVGIFQTRHEGNRITFEYTPSRDESRTTQRATFGAAPIFTVEALSPAQYWEQIGSYPGQFETLVNAVDTFLIYQMPREAFYSGLSDEEFQDFRELVPQVVLSFDAERATPIQ